MASLIPALPLLAGPFDASYSSLQWLVSGYLLGLGLFQPIQGWLCDRCGRRPVLLGGFSLFAVASILASLATSLPLLIMARLLQAAGVSVATVVSRAIVRDRYEPEQAAVALAFITAVMGLSPVIAPLAGGALADLTGWRGVFWMHALVAIALLIWMSIELAESRPADTWVPPLRRLFTSFAGLLRQPAFRAYTAIYMLVSAGTFAFIPVGADLFRRLFGLQATQFGALWASLAVAYVAGAATAGTLARRTAASTVLRIGSVLQLLAAAMFVAAALLPQPSLPAFVAALAVLLFSNSLISPMALAGAASASPQQAGTAAGLSSSIAMLGSMCCTALTGIVYDGTALPSAVLLAVLAIAAAAVLLRTARVKTAR